MDKNVCFFVYVLFVILTARDIIWKMNQSIEKVANPSASSLGGDEIQKEIPAMAHRMNQAEPTVKILYCYSCGYARAFEEFNKLITAKYPSFNVIGSNYNPGFLKNSIAQLLLVGKIAVIFMLMSNINPFEQLGQVTPRVWNWMREHKV